MTTISASEVFWSLAEEIQTSHSDVVEGTIMKGRCLCVGKEFLALCDYKGSGLVVKLSPERVAQLIASGDGQAFGPAGKTFKAWVSVPTVDRDLWRTLLLEGIELAR